MMISRSRILFRKVTIIGIGLIGGSVAKALKTQQLCREVVGVSRRQSTQHYALKNNIVDKATSDLKKAVEGADLVVLGLPVKSIIHVLTIVGKHLRRGCIVTDVGSVKANIVEAAYKNLPSSVFFVGGHPLTGSEKSGIAHADAQLFHGATCILTPDGKTNKGALDKIRHLWVKLGAKVKTLSVNDHDKIMAFVSHVPHLLAYAMVESLPSEMAGFCSSGFKDTTRIAASDAKMWADICLENPKNIIQAIDKIVAVLANYRKAIVSQEEQFLMTKFKTAKEKRDALDT